MFRILTFIIVCIACWGMPTKAQQGGQDLDSVINSLRLKEVVVTAKKIKQRGDTISYSAATYRDKNDKTLADLLAKMPGIEVKPDGQVTYNGKWISEFYIEGMDMLGENYGVATKNLDAQAIGTVEVMNDHQQIKMLRGVKRGSAPAMNIKLRKSAKGVWSSTLEALLGIQPREIAWDASINLMNFRRKSQHISVLKSNNTGTDLRTEINAPSTFNPSYGTGLTVPSLPALDNRYAYRNTSASLTANQLFKIDDDRTLTFNLNYLFDHEKRNSKDVTTYLTDSVSRYAVTETNSANMRQHFVGINAMFKNNGARRFLNNKLTLNASFPSGHGSINEFILQDQSGHSISIVDNLDLNWRNSRGGFADGKFQLEYIDKKGWLRLPATGFSQMVVQRNATASGDASLIALSIPHLMFNLNAAFKVAWQEVRLDRKVPNDPGYGAQKTWDAVAYLKPWIMLHRGQSLQWSLYLPLGVRFYRADENEWDYDKAFFSTAPYTTLNYKYSEKLSYTLSGIWSESLPTALSIMAEKRFIDYRTTISNPQRLKAKVNRSLQASLSATYQSVLDMLFGSLSITYVHSNTPTSMSYEIEDGIIDYIRQPFSTNTNTWQADQTFSKGYFRMNSKISESLTLGISKSGYLISEELHNGRTNYLRASLGYSASFANWVSFATNNEFSLNRSFTDGHPAAECKYSFSNSSSLTIWPTQGLCLTPSVIFYRNNYSSAYRTNVFLNCGVEYTAGPTIFTLKCQNLLDNRVFHRLTDNGITSYSNEFQLRGRTILVGIIVKI